MASFHFATGCRRFALPLLAALAAFSICSEARAQDAAESNVHVTAAPDEFEELGGYGQPQWAERSRASATTRLYVLSPYEFTPGFFRRAIFPDTGNPITT